MKILIIIPYFAPAWGYGGPPKQMFNIAKSLAEGHTVTVVTTDAFDGKQRLPVLEETLEQIKIIRLKNFSNYLAWNFKIFLPRNAKILAEIIAAQDFILLSDFRHALNVYALKYLNKFKKPYSLAAYGQLQNYFGLKYFIKKIFDLLWGKQLIANAKYLIAQTEHEAKDYLNSGARTAQIKLIPLSEAAPSPAELHPELNLRKKYNLNSQTKILLWVGRINKLKGLKLLITAYQKFLQANPGGDYKLILVGRDDGYQEELNILIKKFGLQQKVIQTGPLYNLDNAGAYQAADLFVFTPIFYEETSLAAVRALSFGVPVLTVLEAEMPFLEAYQAGFLISGKIELIKEKLTQLLTNDILLNNYKQNAKRLFAEKFEHAAIMKNYGKLLSK